MNKVWYSDYELLRDNVQKLKTEYGAICDKLGASHSKVLDEIWHELLARAVKESNWQEGLELSDPRTQELASEAFHDQFQTVIPKVDFPKLLKIHRQRVSILKKSKCSIEEIGAYNLSAAYYFAKHIVIEMTNIQLARLGKLIVVLFENWGEMKKHIKVDSKKKLASLKKELARAYKDVKESTSSKTALTLPFVAPIKTEGEYQSKLLDVKVGKLQSPFTIDHIHFFHKLILVGICNDKVCGRLRKKAVHVGVPDVLFPPPSLVPGLVTEFCKGFPDLTRTLEKYDPILKAAEISYKFVAIHPYLDGNGRVSRILMNLILYPEFKLPVYLKSNKTGRHRYAVALKRANNGNIEPLACLIAMSLKEIYEKLIKTVSPLMSKTSKKSTVRVT